VLAALGAGACWGASFLAPRALSGTPSSAIALFRFLFFGLSSLVALALRREAIPRISGSAWKSAVGLSAAGYSLYYFLLSVGVKGIGVPFATALISLLPLTILLASTPLRDWSRLALPIGLIAIGGVLVPLELFGSAYAALLVRTPLERAIGLGATLAALALWTGFAIRNARFLVLHPEWGPADWAGVLGVAAAATAAVLFLAATREEAPALFLAAARDSRVLVWTAFMGVAGGWISSGLWNYASRVLRPAALGMLLVFEAIFGLAYGFLYEGRGPTPREGAAAACLIAGAFIGIRILSRPSDRSTNAVRVPAG
jgi:drug/metabolite transporter (DMT)-like permease